jgi:hypothetical protein
MAIARRERSGADGTHGPRDAAADTEAHHAYDAHDAHPHPASRRAHYRLQSPRTRRSDAALPTLVPRCRGSCRQAKASVELDPKARDALRRVLIRDQADRDAIASDLLRYRDGHGNDWADIIDMMTMHAEARRRVVRVLAEI